MSGQVDKMYCKIFDYYVTIRPLTFVHMAFSERNKMAN